MARKFVDWLSTLGAPEDPIATDTTSPWSAMSLLKATFKAIQDGNNGLLIRANTWTEQNTYGTGGGVSFASSKSIDGVQDESGAWIWTKQTPGNGWSGAVTGTDVIGGVPAAYSLGVRTDTLDTSGHLGYAFGFNYVHVVAANHTGGRVGISSKLTVQGAPSEAGDLDVYTSFQGFTTINANLGGTTGALSNYHGTGVGGDSDIVLGASATFIMLAEAHEFGVTVPTGASVGSKLGITIVQRANDAVRGTYEDAGLVFANNDDADTTWTSGLAFGSTRAKWAFGSDSTLIKVQQRQYPSTDSPTAKYFIDANDLAIDSSGLFIRGPSAKFTVDKDGAVKGASFSFAGQASLISDAADEIALRGGTDPQTFDIYNTYTSATNNERVSLLWSGNSFFIRTLAGSGGGTRRAVVIDGALVHIYTGTSPNTARWFFDSSGHMNSLTDKGCDIGQAAHQVRDLYVGRNVFLSGLPSTDPHAAGELWSNSGVLTVSAG